MARNAFYEAAQEVGKQGGLGGGLVSIDRIKLQLSEGKVILHGSPARVVFRKDKLSIGCTDVDPEALRFLLNRYEAWVSGEEYLLQP